MSDFQSINEAINKRAGRKLGSSIIVSLSLVALIWFALVYRREVFAVVVTVAVLLGIREIVRAFSVRGIYISVVSLALGAVVLTYATWNGGAAGQYRRHCQQPGKREYYRLQENADGFSGSDLSNRPSGRRDERHGQYAADRRTNGTWNQAGGHTAYLYHGKSAIYRQCTGCRDSGRRFLSDYHA